MKIHIGDVFRVAHERSTRTHGLNPPRLRGDYRTLTGGRHSVPADVNKGIFAYRSLKCPPDLRERRPAIILLSNPYKAGQEGTPWIDIIDSDAGYALYNGDNRSPSLEPHEARGNGFLLEVLRLYGDQQLRVYAPPILLFKQVAVGGRSKGYRAFCGYGIPTGVRLRTQQHPRTGEYFSNFVFELALFDLKHENEQFDWNWIDDRRDIHIPAGSALGSAPRAWRDWVAGGDADNMRRNVARRVTLSKQFQIEECDPSDVRVLDEIITYYRNHRHYPFEGLASAIACRVLGAQCRRGWVTKRSGDGGIDFVNRLDLGVPPFVRSFVVLGQAKCVGRTKGVGGEALARLASRLRRGWIGVFVTTGAFSVPAQFELEQDKYPLVLINGKLVASQIRQMMDERNVSLPDLLLAEHKWYDSNVGPMDAARVLDLEGVLPHLELGTLESPEEVRSVKEPSEKACSK